jgi:hypothetical protein
MNMQKGDPLEGPAGTPRAGGDELSLHTGSDPNKFSSSLDVFKTLIRAVGEQVGPQPSEVWEQFGKLLAPSYFGRCGVDLYGMRVDHAKWLGTLEARRVVAERKKATA